jgi:hypothetical protein
MRYVELRRHTDNNGDRLSEQGIADAEAIGRTGLHPPYALFVSTGAERANEMLRILRRVAGQEDIPIATEIGLRSAVEDRWREGCEGCRQESVAGGNASGGPLSCRAGDSVTRSGAPAGGRGTAERWPRPGRRPQSDERGGRLWADRQDHQSPGQG